jgi:hypothetical protein
MRDKFVANDDTINVKSRMRACHFCKREEVLCIINDGRDVEFFPHGKRVCVRCAVQQALVSLGKEIK